MKILFYSLYYSPELTATGKYNGEMIEWLADKGHQIDVITAHPFYPEWKIKSEYKGKGWFTEIQDKVRIFRTPLYVPEKVTGKTRILHELSFGFSSLYAWIPRFFYKYDIVICVCPPLQMGVLPVLYKKIRKSPVVFHIQDLQVDAAKELNLVKSSLLLNSLECIERWILKNATIVSSISIGMKKKIVAKGIDASKFFMLENWVDTNFIKPVSKENSLKKSLGFDEKDRIVLYSGNLGEKQGLEILLEVAKKLSIYDNIKVVLCGEGALKPKLQEKVKEMKIKNVYFLSLQPYEKLSEFLSIADLHLVLQKKAASDLVMPSKLTTILGVGGVAIVSAMPNTNLFEVISEHNIGIIIDPENAVALYESIIKNINNDNLKIKANARSYAESNLNRDNILGRFNDLIIKICS